MSKLQPCSAEAMLGFPGYQGSPEYEQEDPSVCPLDLGALYARGAENEFALQRARTTLTIQEGAATFAAWMRFLDICEWHVLACFDLHLTIDKLCRHACNDLWNRLKTMPGLKTLIVTYFTEEKNAWRVLDRRNEWHWLAEKVDGIVVVTERKGANYISKNGVTVTSALLDHPKIIAMNGGKGDILALCGVPGILVDDKLRNLEHFVWRGESPSTGILVPGKDWLHCRYSHEEQYEKRIVTCGWNPQGWVAVIRAFYAKCIKMGWVDRKKVLDACEREARRERALADEEATRTKIDEAWTPYIERGTGKIYFYNKFLQITAWNLPPNENTDEAVASLRERVQEEESPNQALKRAWTGPYTDEESGQVYYHNKISRVSQWKHPFSFTSDKLQALPATGEARLAVEATDRCPPEATPHRRERELDVHTSLLVPPELDSHTPPLVPPEAICDDARQAVPESAREPASSSAMREQVVRAESWSPRAGTAPGLANEWYSQSLLWPRQNTQLQSRVCLPCRPASDRGSTEHSDYRPATDSGFTEHSEHRPATPPDSEDPPTSIVWPDTDEEDSEQNKWIVGCALYAGKIWPTYRMRDTFKATWDRPQAVPIHRAAWLFEWAVQQWQLSNPEEAAQVGAGGIERSFT